MCPPILTDLLAACSAEVQLAEHLAHLGWASVRFHYRGTGHSDGDQRHTVFEGMCADAHAVCDFATEQAGTARTAMLGTRVGALVAAAVSSRLAVQRLVAWQPVTDPEQFFREALRMRFLREVVAGRRGEATMRSLLHCLRDGGADTEVDVLGYRVASPLFRSLVGESFERRLSDLHCDALVVGVLPDDAAAAGTACDPGAPGPATKPGGSEVTRVAVAASVNWWLTGVQRPPGRRLADVTGRWLDSGLVMARGTS
jgi:hypothetical protein